MPPKPSPKRHPYDQWAPDARALDLVGDKWTLLIVRDLAAGARRFVELQRVLPGISTEQLRSRLNRMVAGGLLTRQRYREVPPRVDYELTARSKELLPVLGSLARWGYDWAWTAPRASEAIDIGAILRIAPGLIEPTTALSGAAHLSVTVDEETTNDYTLTVGKGLVEIAERKPEQASCQIRGNQSDWIDALGPGADLDALQITGDERFATLLIDAIGAHSTRRARAA